MKKLNVILSMLALAFTASAAQAEVKTAPLFDCALTFQAQGGGIKIFVGKFELSGPGQISCIDIQGNTEEIPVFVRIGAKPVTPTIAIGVMKVAGVATGVGLSSGPESLLGGYFVGGVKGALGVGAGAQVALHAANSALTLNGSLQAIAGLGLNIGIDYVEVLDAR